MRSLPSWSWLRLAAGVSAALLLAEFAPKSASASCGDYVTGGLANHSKHKTDTAMPGPLSHKPADAPPCRGPFCSHAPQSPFVPPSNTSNAEEKATGILCDPLLDHSLPFGSLCDSASCQPI